MDPRFLVKKLKSEGKSFSKIGSILGISKDSAKNFFKYKLKYHRKKPGPKPIIDKRYKLRIKRQMSRLEESGEKVNCTKLQNECDLKLSTRTLQRHFKLEGAKYVKGKQQIQLTKKHKLERIRIITQWISANHSWEKTVFTDEKRFTLDGPDCWCSYVRDSKCLTRQKRQCHGGGIMVWLMTFPSGILAYRVLQGKFDAIQYIKLLQDMIVPIIKLNCGNDFYYQEDNSPVHKAKVVKKFMADSNIKVIDWPARSPDINIVEDIWSLLSEMVYDGPQFSNIKELTNKLESCIYDINANKRNIIMNLYGGIRNRLCKVLNRSGNLCNKICHCK